MTEKDKLSWVQKNCKFAAVPLPARDPATMSRVERVVQSITNDLIAMANEYRQKNLPFTPFDLKKQIDIRIDSSAQELGIRDQRQKQELATTVREAFIAQHHTGDIVGKNPLDTPSDRTAPAGTKWPGARMTPTTPAPTGLPK